MATNLTEYSVSELSFALKRTVEDAYGLVRLRGEISGFKRAASGHLYLALKDEKAVIDGVLWRGTAGRLSFKPEDGLEVIATGKLTTYPGRSKYQIVIEHMEPAGAGALMALFEERKKKLESEGLFAAESKRPLPYLPARIGIVTSPTGAVIRDILHRLGERFPCSVILQPVIVQGEGASGQIARAIARFDEFEPRVDLIIVARGGGSIEDLWAFNEEEVARAAAASSIPLISAVGHETDTTLIDFVADRRAPTPTAAAEIAVPVRTELMAALQSLGDRQTLGMERYLQHGRQRIEGLARGLPDPRFLLDMANQRFDDLSERLRLRSPLEILKDRDERLMQRHQRLWDLTLAKLQTAQDRYDQLSDRLSPAPLEARLHDAKPQLGLLAARLSVAKDQCLERSFQRLGSLSKLLDSMSHKRVLERGYAIVHRAKGAGLLRSKDDAEKDKSMEIEFFDGRVKVTTMTTGKKAKTKPSEPQQETLL